jgi:sulfur-oxidizing protein SoxY
MGIDDKIRPEESAMTDTAKRLTATMAALVLSCGIASAQSTAPRQSDAKAADYERWDSVREVYFPGRTIEDGSGFLSLEAPYRAQDAALVPVTVKADLPAHADWSIRTLTLLVDGNPVPLAGKFHLHGEPGDAGHRDLTIGTRVRVNEYTLIHAVAETTDGRLFSAERYVKAAGGCSAPAMKNPEQAMARLGKMKLNLPQSVPVGGDVTAQLLVSHPNHSGMQFDQISRTYVPPYFVRSINVSYAGQPVMDVETDISLSEDPSLHFTFTPKAAGDLKAEVVDSKDQTYTGDWQVTPQPAS